MQPAYLHFTLLAVSITMLMAQLTVRHKHSAHILFAIFCASVSMVALQKLSSNSLGPYQYLIGMGACATCNCIWLLSRTLFREKNPISLIHFAVAVAIAVLIMIQQGYLFATHQWALHAPWLSLFSHMLREATILLSSCILVLSFWEAMRGFGQVQKQDKQQRILFMVTFGSAVLASKSAKGIFVDNPDMLTVTLSVITLGVLASLQYLLYWRFHRAVDTNTRSPHQPQKSAPDELTVRDDDMHLAKQVHALLVEQNYFLQANLKVADIARELTVPEYKISKVLRHQLQAKNFNQFINTLRVNYAKEILSDPDKQHWSVLVIGLECGFASVGPFTRAFKTYTGTTPNQYRQRALPQQHCA
ncbi:helix-turn-helix transcriptional regulator [Pseudoalteromonas sp. SMS1]|uniref:helix-turn-helix domain-containing protein n=1 Tax=Pseudoalteromonas sp. SMS1 TaxID=2908894 RepID=UPI001F2F22A6|nr:helix-turn-helix transcriptional regulator [Pseudoalteromonas sp. SMS1]MCF2856697.1 helix-turn-helix transcriptional regulator [Pseudoalteromonas sp. SMS1]